MVAERWDCVLLGVCTLRGAWYGAVGGTITGLCVFFVGVFYGVPLGLGLGALFGFVNGVTIQAFFPYGRGNLSPASYQKDLNICCLVTSFILDAILLGVDVGYMHTIILTIATFLGLPAIFISACALARFVADWYPRQVDIKPVEYVVEGSVDVWPPAPRHD